MIFFFFNLNIPAAYHTYSWFSVTSKIVVAHTPKKKKKKKKKEREREIEKERVFFNNGIHIHKFLIMIYKCNQFSSLLRHYFVLVVVAVVVVVGS